MVFEFAKLGSMADTELLIFLFLDYACLVEQVNLLFVQHNTYQKWESRVYRLRFPFLKGLHNSPKIKNLSAFAKRFPFDVGAAGFEPAAPWSQTRCATGLRYAPNNFFF